MTMIYFRIAITCVYSLLTMTAFYQTTSYTVKGKAISSYQINIGQEKDHLLKEKMIIDIKKREEIFIVPRYGRNSAGIIVDDFNKKLKLVYNIDKNVCYLDKELTWYETPPKALKAIMDTELILQNASRSFQEVEELITSTWIIGKPLKNQDRLMLSNRMKRLCDKKQIYWFRRTKKDMRDANGHATKRHGPCYSRICTYCWIKKFELKPEFTVKKVLTECCLLVVC